MTATDIEHTDHLIEGRMVVDERLSSYKTFFDHAWAKRIGELADATRLADPVFTLLMNWKAAANTHLMPWLMIEMMRSFWDGYARGDEPFSSRLVAALASRVVADMGTGLSEEQARKLAQVVECIASRTRDSQLRETPALDFSQMWSGFLKRDERGAGEGAKEFAFCIWGAQRLCYAALFHAYENFVLECVRLARGELDYRVHNFNRLRSDFQEAFGQRMAEYCLRGRHVDIARRVRNALAHNGGRMTKELSGMEHGLRVEDGHLQIMAPNTRDLFDTLKVRTYELAKVAVDLPRIRAGHL